MTKPPSKAVAAKPAAPVAAKASAGKPAGAALPDAALLDRDGDGETGDTAAPVAKTGLRRLLPSSVLGWAAMAATLLITLGASTAGALFFVTEPARTDPSTLAGPAHAIDGSTLVVAGQTIRLHGIEAPPASLVCRDGVWEYRCGEDSRRALEQEIQGRTVECLRSNDVTSAQCYNDQGVDLAAALVESGWAVIDVKRSSRYMPQQVRAQNENRGLWRNDFALSEQWRLAGSRSR